MRWRLFLVALFALTALTSTAPAGIFGKKNKPDPKVRVPELLAAVKNDKDESKRSSAAEELRQYDIATFPDIVPTLIDVLLTDAKPGVRSEAADSLGKIRPISDAAGVALEQALAKDTSMRVRLAVRYALMSYHWAGYQNKGKEATPATPPKEGRMTPVPAREAPKGPVVPLPPTINTLLRPSPKAPPPPPVVTPPPRGGESAPPPLAEPKPPVAWKPTPSVTSQGIKIPALPAGPPPGPGPELIPPE